MGSRMVFLMTCLCASVPGEIIDRIAVTIGTQVITQSEIRREIRLTSFLNGEQADFGPAARRKAADRLVEQKLIRREQQLSRYPEPRLSETEPLFRQIQQRFGDRAGLDRAMALYGITETDLREHLLWQLTLLRFVEVRFRPGIEVSEEDIRNYYEQRLKASGGSLDDQREKIEQALVEERVDHLLAQWLARAKQRNKPEYRKGVFE